MHVVDVSHPFHERHIEVVNRTLVEIGAGDIPVILVLNKTDRLPAEETTAERLAEREGYYRQFKPADMVFISAASGLNVPQLKDVLFSYVKERFMKIYPNYQLPQYTGNWDGQESQ
mgnify:CR=1 FL=1